MDIAGKSQWIKLHYISETIRKELHTVRGEILPNFS